MVQGPKIQDAIKAPKITFDSLINSEGSESVLRENGFSNFTKLLFSTG